MAAAGAGLLVFLGKFEAWQVPLFVIGIMLVISAPSMAIAWLKLRKRNLGPILDANGWAVNAKAKMNVPFGGALTGVAALPPGATFGAADKFAEKTSVWPKLLLVAFLIWFVWAFLNDSDGRLNRWTNGQYGKPPTVAAGSGTDYQHGYIGCVHQSARCESANSRRPKHRVCASWLWWLPKATNCSIGNSNTLVKLTP